MAKPKSVSRPRPRRAGKRELNKERTRERILEVALDLFAKRGFQATTTKEISRRVRIAEGALFNYFETKEDLTLYFVDKQATEAMEWYRAQKRLRDAPLAEQLFALIHRHLEVLSPYEEFIGAVYFRALQPKSKLHPLSLDAQERNVRFLRFFRDILAEAEAREEIPPLGDMGAYALGVLCVGVLTYWLHDPSPNKERTLAFLDRSLKLGVGFARKGGWEW